MYLRYLPPYLCVYGVRMPDERKTSGPWTIYRRKEDADMWRRFEKLCGEGRSPSAQLASLAREFVIRRSGI